MVCHAQNRLEITFNVICFIISFFDTRHPEVRRGFNSQPKILKLHFTQLIRFISFRHSSLLHFTLTFIWFRNSLFLGTWLTAIPISRASKLNPWLVSILKRHGVMRQIPCLTSIPLALTAKKCTKIKFSNDTIYWNFYHRVPHNINM